MIIKLKRAYDDYSKEDGFRILVDRLWPRGIKKEDLHMDYWAKDIAPSNELRKWFHENPDEEWAEFTKRYKKELDAADIDAFLKLIADHDTVTLLYSSKDHEHNNAVVLKEYIESSKAYSRFSSSFRSSVY